MKSIIKFLALSVIFIGFQISPAHGQMWSSGNKVSFDFPTGMTGHTSVKFPSWNKPVFVKSSAADTFKVQPVASVTWVKIDTLVHVNGFALNYVLSLDATYAEVGDRLYVQAQSIDTIRTLYVNIGTTAVDTLSVISRNTTRGYVWNGESWMK